MTNDIQRTPTAIDQIAEEWVDTLVDLDPTVGTYIGRTEGDGRYGDYSPVGHERFLDAAKTTIAQLDAARPVDSVDEVTQTDLRSELSLTVESSDAQLQLRDLNVIASPAQEIREIFDLMPTKTVEDWANISSRLGNLPAAIDGYIETLRRGIERGVTPARRQVREVFAQAQRHASNDGFFAEFTANGSLDTGTLPASLAKDLGLGARQSATAYDKLATFFRDELEGKATENDAIGRDLYALASRRFLGATIDLDETYEWGIEELARMVEEQEKVADQIKPGASVLEAIAYLDTDPSRKLHGTHALQEWMQKTSDKAVADLAETQFDIPDEIKTIECMIAPTQEGGIYYTGPTDDFSRPGRMWWSVPVGVTEFDTWRELTTVYHEGVPGHHLQIGQAVYNRAKLNTWRRQLAGTSGHAEGWALYAERLMEQLGYLDDPADRLGMLDGQRMRAARVVLDIGVHLGKQLPDGSGPWTADYAFEFLGQNVNMNESFVKFEVNRYLGWPGQAPSYKVGQRIWEQLRDAAQQRQGAAFSIKEFHRAALDLGGVGLDTLRSTLLK
ncbi:DUF885 domain-containing protein [Cryobacterium levicorallinum]|uniref:DUF885 domain-containing protein n=1 Tax=Cryobacterium levicorallinum TaxID=995038 RepID=A0A1I2YZQ5_9MICO|nr:DUF885 domain-containing protein [Cryobacterium levicorallinum]TFB82993.1 DUF885 domain-containing protein [Cryobacterium levicorallinum]GEP25546.1 hypothetical protein CLE01_01440 [Cryobacterium levicorallinum]SFH31064.1 Uncharacterized conserved protein, DUF885 familyt [Cryobacterium levicorallinum]